MRRTDDGPANIDTLPGGAPSLGRPGWMSGRAINPPGTWMFASGAARRRASARTATAADWGCASLLQQESVLADWIVALTSLDTGAVSGLEQ
jgi:hypothetical protein